MATMQIPFPEFGLHRCDGTMQSANKIRGCREAGQKINAIRLLDRSWSCVVACGASWLFVFRLLHARDRLFRTTKFISRTPNSLTLVMAPWNIDAVPLASCESRVKVLSRLRGRPNPSERHVADAWRHRDNFRLRHLVQMRHLSQRMITANPKELDLTRNAGRPGKIT